MPLYTYKCEICENEFEELVRNADEKVECPKCKSSVVKRKLPTIKVNGSSNAPKSSGFS
ncbi:zinc ribbon domain-containing protein [Caloramator sp. mosi_1]|uniref:FmdB family zinc ribbon protein n=1 Tax=Caloramator sp. mosi_1 TaxID=3023090 RepID=UPI00235FCE93|nr:zinc ribbon domain-containing protein [Caloramator sp. mosi_1]WDC84691.1 zinc ribbon domain-containing protein [Caloramator sp. mosi_1]